MVVSISQKHAERLQTGVTGMAGVTSVTGVTSGLFQHQNRLNVRKQKEADKVEKVVGLHSAVLVRSGSSFNPTTHLTVEELDSVLKLDVFLLFFLVQLDAGGEDKEGHEGK